MDRPIYALTEEVAYEKVLAKYEESILQEIKDGFSAYLVDSPSTADGLTCYKIYNPSSHAEVYKMGLKKDVIVKLVKHVKTEPVLVKNETMIYDHLYENNVIAVDVLALIIDKEDHIECLYKYYEKAIA